MAAKEAVGDWVGDAFIVGTSLMEVINMIEEKDAPMLALKADIAPAPDHRL